MWATRFGLFVSRTGLRSIAGIGLPFIRFVYGYLGFYIGAFDGDLDLAFGLALLFLEPG